MTAPRLESVGILGIGLMGASLALGLKKAGAVSRVVGYSRSPATREQALSLGVVDAVADSVEALAAQCQVLVVCVPTLSVPAMFQALASCAADCVITDVASVKGSVREAAISVWGRVPGHLVLGHPIAGAEKSGVTAGKADLYENHKVILTPEPDTDPAALALVRGMWQAVGADVVDMSVEDHDRILAFTSHLPHLLAYALVDTLAQQNCSYDIFRFAAGGFRDFTRIAASDPQMWHDIVLGNRSALLGSLDQFSHYVSRLRTAIEAGDSETILNTFSHAKAERERFARMLAERAARADAAGAGE